MAEKFQLFRLSLLPREQGDLFSPTDTREVYLRRALAREYEWERYGVSFHYVPAMDEESKEVVIGRVGRSVVMQENLPPAQGLTETVHEGWKALIVVVDPRHHDDGQKVAVSIDPKVGNAASIALHLFKRINETNTDADYQIECQPIIDTRPFWDFAEKNKGQITVLTFDFVVPNMFGTKDNLDQELRDFRNREHAQRVSITLKSDDGLDTDTERTKEAVNYAGRGGGTIKAKTKTRKRFNSAKLIEETRVEVEDDRDESALKMAGRLFKRILGRE